jgi:hypothetical protein
MLVDFSERPITFPPTYKYKLGSQEYNLRFVLLRDLFDDVFVVIFLLFFLIVWIVISILMSSEPAHKRNPAYTDRIIYKEKTSRVQWHCYDAGTLGLSDHKPIFLLGTLPI